MINVMYVCVFNLNWWIFPLLIGELRPQADHTRAASLRGRTLGSFQRLSDDITGLLQGPRKTGHPAVRRWRPDGGIDRTAGFKLNGLAWADGVNPGARHLTGKMNENE